jgi:hypothetical protein
MFSDGGNPPNYEDYQTYAGGGDPPASITINFPGGYTFTDSANYRDYLRVGAPGYFGWDVLLQDYDAATPAFWDGSQPPAAAELALEFDAPPSSLAIPSIHRAGRPA